MKILFILSTVIAGSLCPALVLAQEADTAQAESTQNMLNDWNRGSQSQNDTASPGAKGASPEEFERLLNELEASVEAMEASRISHDASTVVEVRSLETASANLKEVSLRAQYRDNGEREFKARHWRHAMDYFVETARWCDNAEAAYRVAQLYARGLGVAEDAQASMVWLRQAAGGGNARAQYVLGQAHYDGKQLPKDEIKAFAWWRKAADQGQPDAAFRMGMGYMQALGGLQRDFTRAEQYLQRAASQAHAQAQYALGRLYLAGHLGAKNPAAALEWVRAAAETGIAGAQHDLGAMYLQGVGVHKDTTEGIQWMALAAEQGHANAQYAMGLAYYNGEGGVSRNVQAAKDWFTQAAAQNHSQAKAALEQL